MSKISMYAKNRKAMHVICQMGQRECITIYKPQTQKLKK